MVKTLNKLTGLELEESDDLFESMQSMQDAVFFSASLNTLAGDLTRIANDFRLLSSGPTTGLDEIRLPTVQPGSSIMPGKVNPVLAEMLNMAMFHVQGNNHAVALAGQAGQLELNVMMPIIAHNLFEMMHVIIGAVKAFTDKCVVGLQANEEKATGWLSKNPILVTALNAKIGYENGAKVAKKALAENRSLIEVVVEMGLLSEAEAREALDARSMTDGGIA
jgi:fumarate hydratase class II